MRPRRFPRYPPVPRVEAHTGSTTPSTGMRPSSRAHATETIAHMEGRSAKTLPRQFSKKKEDGLYHRLARVPLLPLAVIVHVRFQGGGVRAHRSLPQSASCTDPFVFAMGAARGLKHPVRCNPAGRRRVDSLKGHTTFLFYDGHRGSAYTR